jgi:hypothetical protein
MLKSSAMPTRQKYGARNLDCSERIGRSEPSRCADYSCALQYLLAEES